MKVLVFSDTHLTERFDSQLFAALKRQIEFADKVIINGDFWDGYVTTFDNFLTSPWQALFPLLKAKEATYIHGNHDRPEFADQRMQLFSVEQGLEYRLKLGDFEYVITHGHLLSAAVDDGLKMSPKQLKSRTYRSITKAFAKLEHATIKIFGKAILHFGWYHHRRMKRWIKKNLAADQCLICGHSHTPEVNYRRRFFNPGAFNYGLASCLWIDDSGVSRVVERYR